jgi:transcriptional regulator with XRE-family HTH domain
MPVSKKQPDPNNERRLRRLGKVLKKARENLRYSARQLATHSGVSASQILRIESGEFDFSVSNLLNVANSLAIPIGTVLEWASVPLVSRTHVTSRGDGEMHYAAGPWDDSEQYEMHLECVKELVDAVAEICIELILSSDPAALARSFDFDYRPANDRVRQFAAKLSPDTTNPERQAQIKAIIQKPFTKLRSLGVIDEAFMDQYRAWWFKAHKRSIPKSMMPRVSPPPFLQDALDSPALAPNTGTAPARRAIKK